MSKLTRVRASLERNPKIVIVGAPEVNHLPDTSGFFSHTIDFYVAPKKGGVYRAKKLQELLLSLVPGLKPTEQDDFHDWGRYGDLAFGKLYFDEVIGTEEVHTQSLLKITDQSLLTPGKRIICGCGGRKPPNEKWVVSKRTDEIRRRTWLRLYPNAKFAAAALKGINTYSISKSDLAKYR